MKEKNVRDIGSHCVVALRPEKAEDEALLAEIYAGTREDELNLTNWDAATRAAFLDMQFKAMLKGYRSMYAQAQFSIILSDGKAVGRIVVDRAPGEIRVVDVALLPAHCGHGIGTKLMRDVMDEAAGQGKPVRLTVFHGTRAIAFYQRLGFRIISKPDIYLQMEWTPPG
ncbi:MAG TPA: GNAT family N-acetyltransferase [Verrucomicrobiae bacterium]|nr:GNAT family N-acetyltransferase [Verrucomicrobiae bacterium]